MSENTRAEIEYGVAIPPAKRGGKGGRMSHYPFDSLVAPDETPDGKPASFLEPLRNKPHKVVARNVQVAKNQYAKRHPGRHFTVRTVYDDDGTTVVGVGVWRTA